MSIESTDGGITIHVISGLPSFLAVDRLEARILVEAGMVPDDLVRSPRPSPTTFHLALSAEGTPLGVASSIVGPLAELPLGLAMLQAGIEVGPDAPLPGPTCELISMSVDPLGQHDGIAEALYRSFYRRARASAASSVAVGLDPWVLDVLREQYGVPFSVLGPTIDLLGRTLLPVGGELVALEAGVASAAPGFHAFLTAPVDDEHTAGVGRVSR